MTILKKETKDNNRVELTIRVEKPEWQKALDDAYQANRDLYPVDGCAPGKATRQALEQAYDQNLTAEREIIAIVVPADLARPVLDAVNHAHGLRQEAQTILCALPIDHIVRLG